MGGLLVLFPPITLGTQWDNNTPTRPTANPPRWRWVWDPATFSYTNLDKTISSGGIMFTLFLIADLVLFQRSLSPDMLVDGWENGKRRASSSTPGHSHWAMAFSHPLAVSRGNSYSILTSAIMSESKTRGNTHHRPLLPLNIYTAYSTRFIARPQYFLGSDGWGGRVIAAWYYKSWMLYLKWQHVHTSRSKNTLVLWWNCSQKVFLS